LHEVRAGNFREDLYYRFEIVKVRLPPLRERKEDITMLVERFLESFGERNGRQGLNIAWSTMEKLQRHAWPGNVRELKNFVERAALLADSDRLETRYLNIPQAALNPEPEPEAPAGDDLLRFDGDLPFKDAKNRLVETFETRYWMRLLRKTDGNVSKAARIAGVHRKSVEYILKKLDISRADLGEDEGDED
jgi:DNA-binding NtrC family response regulator